MEMGRPSTYNWFSLEATVEATNRTHSTIVCLRIFLLVPIKTEIIRDKTMGDKLLHISNDNKQN